MLPASRVFSCQHTLTGNYAAARLVANVGLRVNEVRMLDLDDVRWELGRFGELNVRHGKGSRRRVTPGLDQRNLHLVTTAIRRAARQRQ